MSKEPHIDKYMDDEERELVEAIEADNFAPQSIMTDTMRDEHQEAARNTISGATEKISIRLPRTDLARVKAKALREGIPYQTLLKSIIHQAVQR